MTRRECDGVRHPRNRQTVIGHSFAFQQLLCSDANASNARRLAEGSSGSFEVTIGEEIDTEEE